MSRFGAQGSRWPFWLGGLGFIVLVLLLAAYRWTQAPLDLRAPAGTTLPLEVYVKAGSGASGVAERLVAAGVDSPALLLQAWFRWSGQGDRLKAGHYELEAGITPQGLLRKLVRGEQALRSITFVEGWNIRQVLRVLNQSSDLTPDLKDKTPAQVMAAIGLEGEHPEGRFFPDTYRFAKRAPASQVLRLAAKAMDRQLAQAWAQRAPDLPLSNPRQALILASIVEKETGREADRGQVAGVFANRLRIGMRLQTDPTVIYGLGEAYTGRLRRVDLDTDTAYNTYTRGGLPPTPIAMPGRASLLAAVRPDKTPALYFVARGDGSSQFSNNLEAHNAAVRRYILGR